MAGTSTIYIPRLSTTHKHLVVAEHATPRVPWRRSSLRRAHTVIVRGIDDLDRALPAKLVRARRRAIDRGARVASICSGAFSDGGDQPVPYRLSFKVT